MRTVQKLMERYGLSLPDFFHGEDALRDRIAAKLVPPALIPAACGETAATVDQPSNGCSGELLAFDPTLARALERSAQKDAATSFPRSKGKWGAKPCAATMRAQAAMPRRSTA